MDVANKTTSTWKAYSKRNTVDSKRKGVGGDREGVKHDDADDHRPTVRVAHYHRMTQVHEAHCPPMPQAPFTPQVHKAHCPPVPQVQSNNSSHIHFGTPGDKFATGSHVSSKKKLILY